MAVRAKVAISGIGSADEQLDAHELEALASFVAPGGTFDAEPATSNDEVARLFNPTGTRTAVETPATRHRSGRQQQV